MPDPNGPGRSCPVSYRTRPEDLAATASLATTTLYVVGGLYGSVAALEAVLARAAREAPAPLLVFNGDFHYLDVETDSFRTVAEAVAAHRATRGNVEAELCSAAEDAGCGCGYPPYVDDATVDRSNQVMARLRATAATLPELVAPLAALPAQLAVEVGGVRVGIVHGDPEGLAGWRLALEALEPGDAEVRARTGFRGPTTTPEQIGDWLRRGQVRVLACTHTGLPYAQDVPLDGARGLVVNNGTAGLPSFTGLRAGVLTRLSADPAPPPDALYGRALDGLRCDALPVRYDPDRREHELLAAWPPGSPAHLSYAARLRDSTPLRLEQAARGAVTVALPASAASPALSGARAAHGQAGDVGRAPRPRTANGWP